MNRRKRWKPNHNAPARPASFAANAGDESRRNLPVQARTLVANARNDITIPYYSGRMTHVDDTLVERGGGKGLKIYDEIERDTWAGSALDKRKKQLTAREWKVVPASDAPRDAGAAEFVRSVLKAISFDRLCEDLLDATLKGFAIAEVVWKRSDLGIVPEMIVAHDQRRFAFDEFWQPRLLTLSNMYTGEELPTRKFIVHRYGVKGNNPYGLGLGSSLFWPVLFKREGIAFWLHFLDKFAGPTVIAETPFGSLPEIENRLLNAITEARTSSAILAPIGSNVKFLEASRSGSVTYRDFLEFWDKQISVRVTGETLTTDVGAAGSRAAAETHADMLGLLVDSDSDALSGTLHNTLIRWLVEYNFPGAGIPSVWRERPSDAKAEAEVMKAEAEAATAQATALTAMLRIAARIEEDDLARSFIVSSGLLGAFDDDVIDALVAIRNKMPEPPAGNQPPPTAQPAQLFTKPAPRLPGLQR